MHLPRSSVAFSLTPPLLDRPVSVQHLRDVKDWDQFNVCLDLPLSRVAAETGGFGGGIRWVLVDAGGDVTLAT
jgi:hypothetical protein